MSPNWRLGNVEKTHETWLTWSKPPASQDHAGESAFLPTAGILHCDLWERLCNKSMICKRNLNDAYKAYEKPRIICQRTLVLQKHSCHMLAKTYKKRGFRGLFWLNTGMRVEHSFVVKGWLFSEDKTTLKGTTKIGPWNFFGPPKQNCRPNLSSWWSSELLSTKKPLK